MTDQNDSNVSGPVKYFSAGLRVLTRLFISFALIYCLWSAGMQLLWGELSIVTVVSAQGTDNCINTNMEARQPNSDAAEHVPVVDAAPAAEPTPAAGETKTDGAASGQEEVPAVEAPSDAAASSKTKTRVVRFAQAKPDETNRESEGVSNDPKSKPPEAQQQETETQQQEPEANGKVVGTTTAKPNESGKKQDAADETPKSYTVSGIVAIGGRPAQGVTVLLTAPAGTLVSIGKMSPKLSDPTKEDGSFRFENVSCATEYGKLTIIATKPWSFSSPYWRTGRRVLCSLKGCERSNSIISTYRYAIALVGLFVFGLLAATLPVQSWTFSSLRSLKLFAFEVRYPARLKYVSALAMTTLVSASIILVLGMFQMNIGDSFESADENRVVNLGAAYLHQGTYVKNKPKQLLLSLSAPHLASLPPTSAGSQQSSQAPGNKCGTSCGGATQSVLHSSPHGSGHPPANGSPSAIPIPQGNLSSREIETAAVSGLGAPLWVIMLGAVGAFAFAIQLIVSETGNPPENLDKPFIRSANDPEQLELWNDDTHGVDLRKRCAKFVELQFHALFSPLAAIIVYQLLVAADAANEFVTVAIIILASALAVPFILRSAQRSIAAFLNENSADTQ